MKKNPIKLRTIFMGTSTFSASILEKLIEEKYKIVSVYTQPDKKVGRDQKSQSSPVKLIAQKSKLKIKEIEKFNLKSIEDLKRQKPDLIVVVAYGKILPKEVLKVPGFGSLNIHASLLPKYRGPSPVQNAILNGEKETGITLMLMDEGVDSGKIIVQEKILIGKDALLPEIMKKLSQLASDILIKNIPHWIERKLKSKQQDATQATFCQLIERADGKIFWNEKAVDIYNKFRAFYPWPGIFTFWEENGSLKRIKLNKISFSEKDSLPKKSMGEVFEWENKIAIQSADGIIFIEEVQIEGKGNSAIKEFINGHPNFIGAILK